MKQPSNSGRPARLSTRPNHDGFRDVACLQCTPHRSLDQSPALATMAIRLPAPAAAAGLQHRLGFSSPITDHRLLAQDLVCEAEQTEKDCAGPTGQESNRPQGRQCQGPTDDSGNP